MRSCCWVIAALILSVGSVQAEEKPNPDQLKKAYDDALVQLKAAQNSKNDLAKQNEKLNKQIQDLGQKLAAAQAQVQDLKRQVAENDERSFDLRSYCAAWRSFLRAHPDLLVQWKAFLGNDPLAVSHDPQPLIEPVWPLLDQPTETAEREPQSISGS